MSKLFTLIFLLFTFASCQKELPEPQVDPPHISPTIQGKIYVANEYGGTISVIDAATNSVIKTINLETDERFGLMPHNVQASPDGKTVWVTVVVHTHELNEEIVVIDAATDNIIKRIELGVHLHLAHVVFDASGKFAFVTATEANKVFEICTESHNITRTFVLQGQPEPHGLRHFEGKLYMANLKSNSVSVIDLQTAQITEVSTGGRTVQTAVTQDGKFVFASVYDKREVVKIDRETLQTTHISLPGSKGPVQLYATPDNNLLFVCDQGKALSRDASTKVYVIDIAKNAVVNTIESGKAPHGVVISPGGEYAYVTNMIDFSVSVIEISTLKVIKKIPVGYHPNGISFLFDGGGMP